MTDAYGSVVLSIPSEYQGMEVSVKTCNATYSRGIYDEIDVYKRQKLDTLIFYCEINPYVCANMWS